MRVTVTDRLRDVVKASKQGVFLRRDFDELGNYRQVGRALEQLQSEEIIIHAGHGVYTKPSVARNPELMVERLKKRLGKRINRRIEIGSSVLHVGKKVVWENAQTRLDRFKLQVARVLLQRHPVSEIRKKSLENLSRWKANGVWNPGYQEWENLLLHASDARIKEILYSDVEEPSNRLRQSPPYAGLLDQKTLEDLRAKK
ncbi:hypothetical protein [Methylovorus glucosotrophus]|uniref:Type IV toxin-antitoxin system AbiEi family antitoxin domain-containing protein n=1 Tax=Methylovorus glucosotrophus (strain SIP3-4) TaxID=582744 RepID=C6XEM6_METGS|nr:hypothetical protein [Methylovorus glucosotrophus]ACT52083.1 hypothetical protein Msip34_2859 [Methylovorus glucosotrophus SIP3-4]